MNTAVISGIWTAVKQGVNNGVAAVKNNVTTRNLMIGSAVALAATTVGLAVYRARCARKEDFLLEEDGDAVCETDLNKRTVEACSSDLYDDVKLSIWLESSGFDPKKDLNQEKQNGHTPLTLAIFQGRDDIVDALWLNDVDFNHVDSQGWAPLIYAIEKNNLEIVTLLLDSGAGINCSDNSGELPLEYAKRKDREAIVALLEQRGAKTKAAPVVVTVPTLAAPIKVNPTVVAAPTPKPTTTETPTVVAKPEPTPVAVVVEKKTEVPVLKHEGDKAAIPVDQPTTPRNRRRNVDYYGLLLTAVNEGNSEEVSRLKANGINLDMRFDSGWTPLTRAITAGNETMVSHVLDLGADANVADETGTPLALAVDGKNLQIVNLLIDNGAMIKDLSAGHYLKYMDLLAEPYAQATVAAEPVEAFIPQALAIPVAAPVASKVPVNLLQAIQAGSPKPLKKVEVTTPVNKKAPIDPIIDPLRKKMEERKKALKGEESSSDDEGYWDLK